MEVHRSTSGSSPQGPLRVDEVLAIPLHLEDLSISCDTAGMQCIRRVKHALVFHSATVFQRDV
mgnify:CR=1 FL=1